MEIPSLTILIINKNKKFVFTSFFMYIQLKNYYCWLRTLKDQLDILKMCSLKYLPSSSLLKIWNNLPLDLKRRNSLSIFKNRLLNSLFENYITMCYKPNCYSCKTNYICFNMLWYLCTSQKISLNSSYSN